MVGAQNTREDSGWEAFKQKRTPLAKIREIKAALPDGPGLPAMYGEVEEHGTLFGIPVLRQGRSIYLPRQRVVERIERGE